MTKSAKKRIAQLLRHLKSVRAWTVSALTALVMLLACYLLDNWAHSPLSGPSLGQRVEQAREILGNSSQPDLDDYLFVNIAYDRQLVAVYDEDGFPKGETDITDRTKLNTFLSRLDNQHRYLLLDIEISDRLISEADSALVQTLLNTSRLALAHSSTFKLLDDRLLSKAGYVDYSTNIEESNFVKYEYVQNDQPTLPYRLYIDENPDYKIRNFGPFYYNDYHLCWKSLTLNFPIKIWGPSVSTDAPAGESDYFGSKQEMILYNLGSNILDYDLDIPTLVKNKIVIVGDFTENDFHDTYLGKISGPIIHVNALRALQKGEIVIPWWLISFLFIFYSFSVYFVLKFPKLSPAVDRWMERVEQRSSLLVFLLTFVSFSLIYGIVALVIYIISGIDINIFIPVTFLSILMEIIKFNISVKSKKQRYATT